MFKFDIIDKKRKISKIKQLTTPNKDKGDQNKTPTLRNSSRTTYSIVKNAGNSFKGGACLAKKRLEDIDEEVRELITAQTIQEGFVWECSNIYLELSPTFPLSGTSEAEKLTKKFYKGLFEEFVDFGRKFSVSFVIMKLSTDTYISTKNFGLWPYVVELNPQKSLDGLFHGVLPLKGSQYEAYKKTWETLDPFFNEIHCEE